MSNETVLLGAFLSFMLFVVFEVIAGLQAQSLSLIGDAASMANSALGDLSSWVHVRSNRVMICSLANIDSATRRNTATPPSVTNAELHAVA